MSDARLKAKQVQQVRGAPVIRVDIVGSEDERDAGIYTFPTSIVENNWTGNVLHDWPRAECVMMVLGVTGCPSIDFVIVLDARAGQPRLGLPTRILTSQIGLFTFLYTITQGIETHQSKFQSFIHVL